MIRHVLNPETYAVGETPGEMRMAGSDFDLKIVETGGRKVIGPVLIPTQVTGIYEYFTNPGYTVEPRTGKMIQIALEIKSTGAGAHFEFLAIGFASAYAYHIYFDTIGGAFRIRVFKGMGPVTLLGTHSFATVLPDAQFHVFRIHILKESIAVDADDGTETEFFEIYPSDQTDPAGGRLFLHADNAYFGFLDNIVGDINFSDANTPNTILIDGSPLRNATIHFYDTTLAPPTEITQTNALGVFTPPTAPGTYKLAVRDAWGYSLYSEITIPEPEPES